MLQKGWLRRVVRAVWCLLAAGVIAAVPLLILEFRKHDYSVQYQAWFIAGIFVLVTVPCTSYEVAMHLEYFTRPRLQLRVIRILWMVPIYAIDAWFALRFKDSAPYLDSVRECYEAFVIYNFYMYLVAYLEDELGDVDVYYSTKEVIEHMWPLNKCMEAWPAGEAFFWQCKKGVMSYVIMRPLMTLTGFVAGLVGVYGDGEMRLDRVYFYTAFVNNFTQCWALYCLVLMYDACKQELAPIRPLAKFLSVKGVVFFTFWQSVAISLLVWAGVIKNTGKWTTYDVDDIAAGLQDFAICIEMFVAALVHAYAFPPRDYYDPSMQKPQGGLGNALRLMFDVTDVVDDVQGVVDETVQDATDTVARTGRLAWTTTATTAKRVADTPRSLLDRLTGAPPRRSRKQQPSGAQASDDLDFEGRQPLMGRDFEQA